MQKEPSHDRLDEFLKRDPSGNIETGEWRDLTPEFVEIIRKLKDMQIAHDGDKLDQQNHSTFEELKYFTDEFKRKGEQWQMPEHLMNCSLCLDSFEIILKGTLLPEEEIVNRYLEESIGRYKRARKSESNKDRPFFDIKFLWPLAVLLAVVLTTIIIYQQASAVRIHVQSGQLFDEHNNVCNKTFRMKVNSVLSAKSKAVVSVADRLVLDLGEWTRVDFQKPMADYSVQVALKCGVLTASAKGKDVFLVKTGYGDVILKDATVRLTCQTARRSGSSQAQSEKQLSPYYNKYMDTDSKFNMNVAGIELSVLDGDVKVVTEENAVDLTKGGKTLLDIPSY